MKTAQYWIKKLNMQEHIEGGYYTESYRTDDIIDSVALPGRFRGSAPFGTAIYFLLKGGQVSNYHKLASDEIWHFYEGSPLKIIIIEDENTLTENLLGPDPEKGQAYQHIVPAGKWFGAHQINENSHTLVGCTMAPGFEYRDFELSDYDMLASKYPAHKGILDYFREKKEIYRKN